MENIDFENQEQNVIYIVKYSSYTDSQKKAIQKYRLKNKDKINELHKKYYETMKEIDPTFLEKKRERAKEYYKRKKEQKNNLRNNTIGNNI